MFRKFYVTGFVLFFCAILVPFRTPAQKAGKALQKEEVVKLLKSYVPPSRIVELGRQYGISFELTPETESELREAGASEDLLKDLRQLLLPATPLPPKKEELLSTLLVETTPGSAQVFVDGKDAGRTSPRGRLELTQLKPGQHTVRLALTGYQDYEQKAELVPGHATRVATSLLATFHVAHVHMIGQCKGMLTIGNGAVRYRSENGKESFEANLSEIVDWGDALAGQFFVRLNGGKRYFFRSTARPAVLEALRQATSKP